MKNCYLLLFLFSFKLLSSQNETSNLFIENKGQVKAYADRSKEVFFELKSKNLYLWVTNKGLVFNLFEFKKEKNGNSQRNLDGEIRTERSINWNRTELTLKGAEINLKNCVLKKSNLPTINFYLPNLSATANTYNDLYFKNIYDGIDWHIFTEGISFKQEFIVHPGADYKQIQLLYQNNKGFNMNNSSITFKTDFGSYMESGLKSLQENKVISTNFNSISSSKFNGIYNELVSYEIPKYDATKKIIIDPILSWCTFFGASVDEDLHSVYGDATNTWFAGHSNSFNFPTLNPGSGAYFQGSQTGNGDSFILKFNTQHNLVWATYFGGTLGEESTAIHSNGTHVWVTGYTNSTDLPLMNPGGGAYYQSTMAGVTDAYILKFTTGGSLIWSTYVGGTLNEYFSSIEENGGNIFVGGVSKSPNFPTLNAGTFFQTHTFDNDGIVLKFNASNTMVWSTFIGGSGNDLIYSIRTNSNSVFICGNSNSANFNILSAGTFTQNTLGGGFDGFVSKFNLNGTLQWSTLFGGNANDRFNSISLTATSLWLCGTSASTNIPLMNAGGGAYYQPTNASLNDGFVTKFSLNGNLKHSTYYGGTGNDYLMSLTTDGASLFTGGYTSSNTLTLVNPGAGAFYQPNIGGFNDAMFQKFDTSGVLTWATYFGNVSNDYVDGVYSDGSKLFACGYTQSNFLPTINPGSGAYFQSITSGSNDGYIAVFKNCTNPSLTISTGTVICAGANLILNANNVPNASYQWFGPNGFNSTMQSPTLNAVSASNAGIYSLIVLTNNGCSGSNNFSLSVNPAPSPTISYTGGSCVSDALNFTTGSATSYLWQGPNSFSTTQQNPIIANTSTLNSGIYTLTVLNAQGCSNSTTASVTINPLPSIAVPSSYSICSGTNLTLSVSGANSYTWTGPNSFTSTVSNITLANATAQNSGTYFVSGASSLGCVNTASLSVLVSICTVIEANTSESEIFFYTNGNEVLITKIYNDFLFEVIDMTGRILFTTNNETRFELNLAKGVYCARLTSGNKVASKKIRID